MSILSLFKKSFKRKAQRKKARFSVLITPIDVKKPEKWGKPEYTGIAKDISPYGILIETNAPIEIKDLIQLQFALHKAAKPMLVDAATRFMQMDNKGIRTAGLEFIKPDAKIVKYLTGILLIYK
jgi:hypothetical protein